MRNRGYHIFCLLLVLVFVLCACGLGASQPEEPRPDIPDTPAESGQEKAGPPTLVERSAEAVETRVEGAYRPLSLQGTDIGFYRNVVRGEVLYSWRHDRDENRLSYSMLDLETLEETPDQMFYDFGDEPLDDFSIDGDVIEAYTLSAYYRLNEKGQVLLRKPWPDFVLEQEWESGVYRYNDIISSACVDEASENIYYWDQASGLCKSSFAADAQPVLVREHPKRDPENEVYTEGYKIYGLLPNGRMLVVKLGYQQDIQYEILDRNTGEQLDIIPLTIHNQEGSGNVLWDERRMIFQNHRKKETDTAFWFYDFQRLTLEWQEWASGPPYNSYMNICRLDGRTLLLCVHEMDLSKGYFYSGSWYLLDVEDRRLTEVPVTVVEAYYDTVQTVAVTQQGKVLFRYRDSNGKYNYGLFQLPGWNGVQSTDIE